MISCSYARLESFISYKGLRFLNFHKVWRITQAEFLNNASPANYKRYRYTYGYDASNQLTSADYSYWVAGPGWQTSTNYDIPAITYSRSGNRQLSQRRNESGALVEYFEYAYLSGTNRLVEVENTAAPYQDIYSYHFDANGNVASIQNADFTQEVQFKYDASNRVIEIVDAPSGTTTDYRISASGWRYWSKTGSAYATYSPRDGAAPLGEFSVAYYTYTWNLRRPDGTVYGRKPYNGGSQFYWTDALGSVRMRTSTSGSLLEAHDYYPFGQDMIGRSSAGAPVRQGYTGYWRDHEAGLNLYYAGARQYDPATGRFFGVDPLAEDFPTWSGYTYTLNDPVRWRDPDGRSVEDPKAMARAVMNGTLSAFAIVGGYGTAIASSIVAVPTMGGSTPVILGSLAVGSFGSAGLALAIADFHIAYNTPDGMTAESFGNLASAIGKGLGLSASSQHALGLAQDIATGGGLIRAGKLAVDDRILEGVLQVEGLMNSTKNWIDEYLAEREKTNSKKGDNDEDHE